MSKLFNKIGFTLRTYHQGRCAIARQFDAEEITRVQNAKLQKLIHYSFNNIKYYRELFEHTGVKPQHIKTTEDLVNIPVLTKKELREQFWDFLPAHLPRCRVSRTSGSTGIPVCLLSDDNSRLFNSAAVIRYRSAINIPIIGRAILTPLKTEDQAHREPDWTFLQGIHKTYYINPYLDSAQNTEYAHKLLTKLKKPALVGITPAIRALAYRIRDKLFPAFEPAAVLTTGECLEPRTRDLLESIFSTKVTDIYACNEAGDIAWQCHQTDGYHINADNCIVEILIDDKPAQQGEVGEVVITNLNRFSMPIIRYKNGDLARLKQAPCPCGCRLPLIAEIIGRTGEDIFLPSGKVMPWNQLKSLMNHPQIRQFQLIQNEDGSLTIRYIAETAGNTNRLEHLLLYRYSKLLGPSIAIKTEQVEKISPAPSGKSKLVISNYLSVTHSSRSCHSA